MSDKLIEVLKVKNKNLEVDLKSCRQLYQNLMDERGLESTDNRRAFMLKAQIFQLERQCMLLSQAQSSRALILNEVENQLISLIGNFQSLLSEESPGSHIPISRSQLMSSIGTLQKLKNSLYRQSTLESSDDLRVPSLMTGSKYSSNKKPITCLDICGGSLEHLNLRNIAHLELSLSLLYKRLCALDHLIQVSVPQDPILGGNNFKLQAPEKQLFSGALCHLREECHACIKDLSHCCDELVSVSLLHPSAPWAVVQKNEEFGLLNAEEIMKTLPAVVRRKSEVSHCILAMCKVHSYATHMNRLQLNAARSQISYFQQIQEQQLSYVSSLFSGISQAYQECEKDIVQTIREPISRILEAWVNLKGNQSNKCLKEFLDVFKHFESDLIRLSSLKSSTEGEMDSSKDSLLYDFKGNLDAALNKLETRHKQSLENIESNLQEYKTKHEEDIIESLKSLHV